MGRQVWLAVAGIDRSTSYRGIAVVSRHNVPTVPDDVAVYAPASRRHVNEKEKIQ